MHLMYLGADVFRDSCYGLMDRSLAAAVRDKLWGLVEGVDGVDEVKWLRTRQVGHEIFAEIAVGVDSEMTVLEAHRVNEAVKARIHRTIPHVGSLQLSAEASGGNAMEPKPLAPRRRWAAAGVEPRSEG